MTDFVYDQFLLGVGELDGESCASVAVGFGYTPDSSHTTDSILTGLTLGEDTATLTVTASGGVVEVRCPDDEITIDLTSTAVQGYVWVHNDGRLISWHAAPSTPVDPVTVSFDPIIRGET